MDGGRTSVVAGIDPSRQGEGVLNSTNGDQREATKPGPGLPPAGWPMASRPMRIAFLGWARLSMQAREGSGYNLNASDLAWGLALSGHSVSYLRSGMDFSLTRGKYVRRVENWRGVECFDFFNSDNVSPASSNFRNMEREMSSPRDSRVVIGWLDSIGAEIVHVHSLEGYGLDLIGAIRASGRPVVITPHNYWYVCPQVDLLHEELRVCEDYAGGTRCRGCLEAPRAGRVRLRRGVEQMAHRVLGGFWAGTLRSIAGHVKWHWRPGRLARGLGRRWFSGAHEHPAPTPDPEMALGFDVGDARAHSGRIEHGMKLEPGEECAEIGRCPWDQNERFLSRDTHLVVLNNNVYGRRRLAGRDALSAASLVTPPSRFLLDAMRVMGVPREKLRHVRLGQPHFDQLHRRARRSATYGDRPWSPASSSPLRFAFLGTTRNNKGLEVLARAIPLLAKDVRQRCHFLIRASGWDWLFRKRLSVYPEVTFAGGFDHLQLISVMGEFDVGILPHIWFENSPLVMLEMLHAGKFVIASRLGGPPDWIVQPGERPDAPRGNGLLFPGGDAEALAGCMTRVARGEVTLPSAKDVHAASTLVSYPDHVREVEGMYLDLLGGGSGQAKPLAPAVAAPAGVAAPALG